MHVRSCSLASKPLCERGHTLGVHVVLDNECLRAVTPHPSRPPTVGSTALLRLKLMGAQRLPPRNIDSIILTRIGSVSIHR